MLICRFAHSCGVNTPATADFRQSVKLSEGAGKTGAEAAVLLFLPSRENRRTAPGGRGCSERIGNGECQVLALCF